LSSHPWFHQMTSRSTVWLAIAITLSGYASMSIGPPSGYSPILLSVASSPSVEVFSPRFRVKDSRVHLDGIIRRAFSTKSTKASCLQPRISDDRWHGDFRYAGFWPANRSVLGPYGRPLGTGSFALTGKPGSVGDCAPPPERQEHLCWLFPFRRFRNYFRPSSVHQMTKLLLL
jgi:hypothetical protein